MAQLAEQLICNQQVIGSSPIIGFKLNYGRIPEWPKGTDCKSAAECFGGSNPPPPIINPELSLAESVIRDPPTSWVPPYDQCRCGSIGRAADL